MHDSLRGKAVLATGARHGIDEHLATAGPHAPEGLEALDARATTTYPFPTEPGW